MVQLRASNMKSVIKESTNLRVPREVVDYLCQEIEKFIEVKVENIDDFSEGIGSKTLVLEDVGLSINDIKNICSETSTLRASSSVLCRLKILAEQEIARRVKTAAAKAEEMGETTIAMRHFRLTARKTEQIIERGQFLETNSISKYIERNIYPKGVSVEAAEVVLANVESLIEHALNHLASWDAPEQYDGRYEELYEVVSGIGQVGLQKYIRNVVERAGKLAGGETIQASHMLDAFSSIHIEEKNA